VAAGVGATLVMSAYMLGAESHDAIGTPPPVRIVRRVRPGWPADRVSIAATVLHLGIGAGGGLLGALLRRRGVPSSLLAALLVWAIGYEVVVPALRVLPPAHRGGARARQLLRAHLVYAAALALLQRAG
jgi:hypothetical protein